MNQSEDINQTKSKGETQPNVQKPENYGRERVLELNMPTNKEDSQNKSSQDTDTGREKVLAPNSLNTDEQGKETAPVQKSILLGDIDENRIYKIPDEIAKELIVLEKIVVSKDNFGYKAYALCGALKLDFLITVKSVNQEGESPVKVAHLKLVESYTNSQSEKSYIVTTIAKFQDVFTNDYLFKVKKAFHLHSKEEPEGKVFEENEMLAPLTLSLFNRFSLIETNQTKKINPELKHIQDLLKILRTTPKGRVIAERFIKQTNFRTEGVKGRQYSFSELKEILYKMIDSATQQKKLEPETTKRISEAKTKYVAETKKEAAPVQKGGPSGNKPAGKPASAKSSGSKGKDSGKGGGDKKKDKGVGDKKKDKDKDKKKDKDKQMIDIIDLLIERNKITGGQIKTAKTAKTTESVKTNTSQTNNPSQYSKYQDFTSVQDSNMAHLYSEHSIGGHNKTQNPSQQQDQGLSR